MRIYKCMLLMMMAVMLVGCVQQVELPVSATMEANSTPPPTLSPSPGGKTVVAEGQLVSPYPSLALGFGGNVSGQVLTITVKAGDVVQAGEVLAILDETELKRAVEEARLTLERAKLDHARALKQWERDLADAEQALDAAQRALTIARLQYSPTGVEEARTALQRAQEAEANAHENYRRALDRPWEPQEWRDTYYNNWQHAIRERELAELRLADAQDALGVSGLELKTREANVAQAERKLATLREGLAPTYERAVEDARRQLSRAEETLKRARLVAPWAAIVLSVDVAPQALVNANMPVVTLLSLQDGLRFVTQNLGEQHIADLRPGQRAIVTLRTYAETPLEGVVEAIVPQTKTEAVAEARFTVWIRLPPTSLNLLPGLTGRVEIVTP